MNPAIRFISIGIIALLSLAILHTYVNAQTSNRIPNTSARADEYCAEKSIRISTANHLTAEKTMQALDSTLATPELRMMARIHKTLTLMALESLIMNCDIRQSLNPGV